MEPAPCKPVELTTRLFLIRCFELRSLLRLLLGLPWLKLSEIEAWPWLMMPQPLLKLASMSFILDLLYLRWIFLDTVEKALYWPTEVKWLEGTLNGGRSIKAFLLLSFELWALVWDILGADSRLFRFFGSSATLKWVATDLLCWLSNWSTVVTDSTPIDYRLLWMLVRELALEMFLLPSADLVAAPNWVAWVKFENPMTFCLLRELESLMIRSSFYSSIADEIDCIMYPY